MDPDDEFQNGTEEENMMFLKILIVLGQAYSLITLLVFFLCNHECGLAWDLVEIPTLRRCLSDRSFVLRHSMLADADAFLDATDADILGVCGDVQYLEANIRDVAIIGYLMTMMHIFITCLLLSRYSSIRDRQLFWEERVAATLVELNDDQITILSV
ncbi:unnamed protein product, partial [Mesorhabditis spiculigera]